MVWGERVEVCGGDRRAGGRWKKVDVGFGSV